MRTDQVPQDDSFLDGRLKATYAVDVAGRYTLVPSRGYEAERQATQVALEELDARVRRAWESARVGRRSALAYHMATRQMTPGLLAQYAGVCRLRVWWHLTRRGFSGMSPATARRYAESLDLPVEELGRLPPAPAALGVAPPHG